MKQILAIVLILSGFHLSAFIGIAKLGALVVDDETGKPIPNVLVRGGFENDCELLAIKGAPLPNEDFVRTDASGRCRLSGKTNSGEAGAAVVEVPMGYYCPKYGDGFTFKHRNIFGIWQPDNLVVTIRLQRVEHPIPLFVKSIRDKSGKKDLFTQGNGTIRLDLLEGDWLPPVGHG